MISYNPFDIHISIEGMSIEEVLAPAVSNAINSSIMTTLALVRDRWIVNAQNKLSSTRADYLLGLDFDSIQMPFDDLNSFNGAVVLKGQLPNMIEQGYPAFDMKPGLLASNKAKPTSYGGKRLIVPFRHGTPGTFMHGKPMPNDIYKQAKKLKPGDILKVPGAGATSWTGYKHRGGSIYNSMQRIVKQYQNATQAYYMTFRTVSNRSDPKSWWHPGYHGARIAETVMPFALSTLQTILQTNLSNLGV